MKFGASFQTANTRGGNWRLKDCQALRPETKAAEASLPNPIAALSAHGRLRESPPALLSERSAMISTRLLLLTASGPLLGPSGSPTRRSRSWSAAPRKTATSPTIRSMSCYPRSRSSPRASTKKRFRQCSLPRVYEPQGVNRAGDCACQRPLRAA
jgi:hypothetical protein